MTRERLACAAYRVAFLALCALLTCLGCFRSSYVEADRQVPDARAVIVTGRCPHFDRQGSGVMIAPQLVLTVFHVAQCGFSTDLSVTAGSATIPATIEQTWPDHDTMVLRVATPSPVRPTAFAELRDGAHVCIRTAWPTRTTLCGFVQLVDDPTCQNGFCWDTAVDLVVMSGNSGSGVYDEYGRLVGIVTGGKSSPRPDSPSFFMTLRDTREGIVTLIENVRESK